MSDRGLRTDTAYCLFAAGKPVRPNRELAAYGAAELDRYVVRGQGAASSVSRLDESDTRRVLFVLDQFFLSLGEGGGHVRCFLIANPLRTEGCN